MVMGNAATDQSTVLNAILARIQDQVTEFSAGNTCFLVIDPEQFEPSERQELCLTVAPNSGDYDQEVFTGAGEDGLIEQSGFTVTVWSKIKLDRHDQSTYALNNASRGLLPLKKKLLKCLTNWMPTDGTSGAPLLTEFIAPVSAGYPVSATKGLVTLSLSFSSNWLWDLS